MAYLYLVLGAVFGVGKGFFGKKASGFLSSANDSVKINALRMAFSVLIGVVTVLFSKGLNGFIIGYTELIICFVSGLCISLFTVCWLVIVKNHAYLLVDVFLTFGSIVPIFLSSAFFAEKTNARQLIGVCVLTVSALCMCKYNNKIKGKTTVKTVILLILTGIFHGMVSFCQKWFAKTGKSGVEAYNFYTYLTSMLLLTAVILFTSKKVQDGQSLTLNKAKLLNIFAIALCMFLNSLFLTYSARVLPAFTVYPLKQGISLILSLLMSAVIFKERIKPIAVLGIALCFISMLLINL